MNTHLSPSHKTFLQHREVSKIVSCGSKGRSPPLTEDFSNPKECEEARNMYQRSPLPTQHASLVKWPHHTGHKPALQMLQGLSSGASRKEPFVTVIMHKRRKPKDWTEWSSRVRLLTTGSENTPSAQGAVELITSMAVYLHSHPKDCRLKYINNLSSSPFFTSSRCFIISATPCLLAFFFMSNVPTSQLARTNSEEGTVDAQTRMPIWLHGRNRFWFN